MPIRNYSSKKQLAISAARWLAKRDNRDKVIHTVRALKQRLDQERARRDTPSGEHRHDAGRDRRR